MCRDLDGVWGGDLMSEGLRGQGLHLVVTQMIPAGGGPDKEGLLVLIDVRKALGKVWSSGLLGFQCLLLKSPRYCGFNLPLACL